jgi:hypothetical protein
VKHGNPAGVPKNSRPDTLELSELHASLGTESIGELDPATTLIANARSRSALGSVPDILAMILQTRFQSGMIEKAIFGLPSLQLHIYTCTLKGTPPEACQLSRCLSYRIGARYGIYGADIVFFLYI